VTEKKKSSMGKGNGWNCLWDWTKGAVGARRFPPHGEKRRGDEPFLLMDAFGGKKEKKKIREFARTLVSSVLKRESSLPWKKDGTSSLCIQKKDTKVGGETEKGTRPKSISGGTSTAGEL